MPRTNGAIAGDPARTPRLHRLEDLQTRLQGSLRSCIRDLTLVAHDGGIILRGTTRTYYAKQLAQHAVMRATDVPILANQIEVLRAGAN